MDFRSIQRCLVILASLLYITNSHKPPNIIFILVDDLGWNDVSFHGSKQIPTPNIDTLAHDGIALHNYYVQPICTPSRASLMTGKYPIRLGLQHNVIYAEQPFGLPLDETILPEWLRKMGYATHGVGKWHLGYFKKEYIPTNRGFDSFFGYWNGKNDYFTHFEEGGNKSYGLDLHDNERNAWNYFGQYATDVFTKKAIKIVKNHNQSQPLFLFVAHEAVHTGNAYSPLQAPKALVKKFSHIKDHKRREFAAMGFSLDLSVGHLFNTLEETGMLDNSVIILSTDNGGAVRGIDKSTGSNWPLRGSKYTLWEGGVRATGFVWSPLLKKSSTKVYKGLMHVSDWLPTLYRLAGGEVKDLGEIDGYDMWPSLICGKNSPRNTLLHNIDDIWKVKAIRKGKYKLIKGSYGGGNFDGWFDKQGRKENNPHYMVEDDDITTLEEVYDEFARASAVPSILYQKYSSYNYKDYFEKRYSKAKRWDHSCFIDQDEDANEIIDLVPFSSNLRTNTLLVKCGQKPKNASVNCQPKKHACLFDIKKDPCEYHNLASQKPEIVKKLNKLLDEYSSEAVPEINMPSDPRANPKYHGYAWVSWKS